jgi:DNA adenine methylase
MENKNLEITKKVMKPHYRRGYTRVRKDGTEIHIKDYIIREEDYYRLNTVNPTDFYNQNNPDGKTTRSTVLFEYVGNKRSFYKRTQTLLKERIDVDKVNTIVIPFTGSGSDFQNVACRLIRQKSQYYNKRKVVLNDLNPSIVNLFRTIRDDKDGLIREIKTIIQDQNDLVPPVAPTLSDYQVFHRLLRDELNNLELKGIMNLRRTALFIIVMNTTFGGNYEWKGGRSRVGVSTDMKKYKKYANTIEKIEMYSFYMNEFDVIVENKDYAEILKKYDAPDTLFLIDPPYLKQDAKVLVSTMVTYGNPDFPHFDCITNVTNLIGQVIYHNYRNDVQTTMFENNSRFKHVEHEKVINNQKSESDTDKPKCVEVIYYTTDKKKQRAKRKSSSITKSFANNVMFNKSIPSIVQMSA